jgi:hypothetical protein
MKMRKDGRMDGRTDGRKEGRMDGRTERWKRVERKEGQEWITK